MAITTATRSRTSLPDRTLGAVVRATVDQAASCPCGQALEAGHPRYCPRCGVRVVARRPGKPIARFSPAQPEWFS
jgi:hypothetical protein